MFADTSDQGALSLTVFSLVPVIVSPLEMLALAHLYLS